MTDWDIILQAALAVGAVVALCVMQPRWDTGSGAVLIVALGIIGLPFWAPLLMLWMFGMMAWYVVGYPLWWITKPVLRRISAKWPHRGTQS